MCDEQNRYEEAARALKEKEKKGGGKLSFVLFFAAPTPAQKRSGFARARAACLRTHRNVIT
jgi:hypothetical protein